MGVDFSYSNEDRLLTVYLTEEIDQHTAEKVRRKIDDEIERFIPRKVIFDFDNISFMDSSGIGMVLGRYKLAKMLGGDFEIINVNKSIKRIFEMSGVTRIIMTREKNNIKIEEKQGIINEKIQKNFNEEEEDEGII
ncbi:MAG: anti-sigma factor antagonist [Clostridia bacterium]|nr:anti-sigma factor antagonist [Clostridia bacterium]